VDGSSGEEGFLSLSVEDPVAVVGEEFDKVVGVRATLTLSSLVTEGRTTLSNRAIQLHPKMILPC